MQHLGGRAGKCMNDDRGAQGRAGAHMPWRPATCGGMWRTAHDSAQGFCSYGVCRRGKTKTIFSDQIGPRRPDQIATLVKQVSPTERKKCLSWQADRQRKPIHFAFLRRRNAISVAQRRAGGVSGWLVSALRLSGTAKWRARWVVGGKNRVVEF